MGKQAQEQRSPRGRRRSEDARQAVLQAARELVQEEGFSRLTMEAMAAHAGVGKQTIYRWWPSKGAVVFDALLDESQGDDGGALPDTGDLEHDLRTVLRATVADLVEPQRDALLRALTADVLGDGSLAEELVTRLLEPQHRTTRERLERARKAGQVARGVDLDAAVELMFGPIFRRWLLKTGPLNRAFADKTAALVAAALRER